MGGGNPRGARRRTAVDGRAAVWFNRATMTTAPAPAADPAAVPPAGTAPAAGSAPRPAAETPEEAQSRPVSAADAAPPVPPPHTVAVANFRDANKARRVADDLVAAGVPADQVHLLESLEARRELLDVFRRDRPAGHTQAGVGAAIFGAGGAVIVTVGALIAFFGEAPGMQWFVITAFTAGILGACAGGAAGFFIFRPADDPQNPLSEKVAAAGPAVAVTDIEGTGEVAGVPLGRLARMMVRGGGKCRYLNLGEDRAADHHPGDTRGGDFHDAEPQAAPDGRPTVAAA